MNDISLKNIKKVHFIGIGGIGMSALARMMLHEGKQVSGSDRDESPITQKLAEEGAIISIGQRFENVPEDADAVVYTVAIPDDNPEIVRARELGLALATYPEMLGVISRDKYTIAVSGTHGKTTTTAMIADVLIDAGLSPTVIVGSLLSKYKSNFIAGESNYFVVEACEYKRSFCNINPDILVITNIEEDHLDYYKDIEDIKSAFSDVAGKVPQDGFLVTENGFLGEFPGVHQIAYGDYVDNVPKLRVIGEHNRKNAAGALAVADILKVPLADAEKSLADFKGTWRRFEHKGETEGGAAVYDDYGHHPTEVRATIKAAREAFPDKKLVVTFQPHLYSRTIQLFDDFAHELGEADEVFIAPIFAAREKDDGSMSSEKLAEAVGPNAHAQSFEELEKKLSSYGPDSVIITMGAGDIYKVADTIARK